MLTRSQVDDFLETLYNPRWCEPGNKGPILLDGVWNGGKMEFFASPTDRMDYGRAIYQRAINGEYGEIAPYDPIHTAAYEHNELPEQTETNLVPDPTPEKPKDLF